MTMYMMYPMLLFTLGILGLLFLSRHMLLMLISFELMMLAINLNFAFASVMFDDLAGQMYVLFMLTMAAAETALGLAIVMIYYSLYGSANLKFINLLKG